MHGRATADTQFLAYSLWGFSAEQQRWSLLSPCPHLAFRRNTMYRMKFSRWDLNLSMFNCCSVSWKHWKEPLPRPELSLIPGTLKTAVFKHPQHCLQDWAWANWWSQVFHSDCSLQSAPPSTFWAERNCFAGCAALRGSVCLGWLLHREAPWKGILCEIQLSIALVWGKPGAPPACFVLQANWF